MGYRGLTTAKTKALNEGQVIPAHPLALDEELRLDEDRQRALTRYYLDAGVGGIAVGVHTTQFEIHDAQLNLLEPVLRIASEEVDRYFAGERNNAGDMRTNDQFLRIAGICGPTEQALQEVNLALSCGYDIGLVSMGGLGRLTETQHFERIRTIADAMPVCGFYLQPSVGGKDFSYDFWHELANIEGVVAIKVAPFNRYRTIDVVRAVCASPRRDAIALYTGNDDNIIADLLTTYRFRLDGTIREKRIVGGLLGQWAVWTRRAVELLDEIKEVRRSSSYSGDWMTRNIELTDANAALFDARNGFAGSIAGVHEVLRRQGLLQGTWCLNPDERLSLGQQEEIDRVYRQYPHLNDDEFVRRHLAEWLVQ